MSTGGGKRKVVMLCFDRMLSDKGCHTLHETMEGQTLKSSVQSLKSKGTKYSWKSPRNFT
jgi:hypothetical protein